jgi:major membrane immunogen (membrane-anchored lipoprotein)
VNENAEMEEGAGISMHDNFFYDSDLIRCDILLFVNKLKLKLALIILLLLLIIHSAVAEDSGPAILLRGPVPHEGIEFIGANAIPSYYGEYKFQGGIVRTYFTTEEIILSDSWKTSECGVPKMFIRDGEGRIESVYTDRRGWTVFMSFESSSKNICQFIDSYRERQNYFLNIAKDKSVFSFPAILDLQTK